MSRVLAAAPDLVAAAAVIGIALTGTASPGTEPTAGRAPSPTCGVASPDGYRDWRLIGVAQETGTPDELRAVLGNAIALQADHAGTLPFPDGTILVKRTSKHEQS